MKHTDPGDNDTNPDDIDFYHDYSPLYGYGILDIYEAICELNNTIPNTPSTPTGPSTEKKNQSN